MKINPSELKTRVRFFLYEAKKGMKPGVEQKKVAFECSAKIDSVWSKDIAIEKANGTLSDITIVIRDTRGEFIPTNFHFIEIDALGFDGKIYNVKEVQPDPQDKSYLRVIASVTK